MPFFMLIFCHFQGTQRISLLGLILVTIAFVGVGLIGYEVSELNSQNAKNASPLDYVNIEIVAYIAILIVAGLTAITALMNRDLNKGIHHMVAPAYV